MQEVRQPFRQLLKRKPRISSWADAAKSGPQSISSAKAIASSLQTSACPSGEICAARSSTQRLILSPTMERRSVSWRSRRAPPTGLPRPKPTLTCANSDKSRAPHASIVASSTKKPRPTATMLSVSSFLKRAKKTLFQHHDSRSFATSGQTKNSANADGKAQDSIIEKRRTSNRRRTPVWHR